MISLQTQQWTLFDLSTLFGLFFTLFAMYSCSIFLTMNTKFLIFHFFVLVGSQWNWIQTHHWAQYCHTGIQANFEILSVIDEKYFTFFSLKYVVSRSSVNKTMRQKLDKNNTPCCYIWIFFRFGYRSINSNTIQIWFSTRKYTRYIDYWSYLKLKIPDTLSTPQSELTLSSKVL